MQRKTRQEHKWYQEHEAYADKHPFDPVTLWDIREFMGAEYGLACRGGVEARPLYRHDHSHRNGTFWAQVGVWKCPWSGRTLLAFVHNKYIEAFNALPDRAERVGLAMARENKRVRQETVDLMIQREAEKHRCTVGDYRNHLAAEQADLTLSMHQVRLSLERCREAGASGEKWEARARCMLDRYIRVETMLQTMNPEACHG